MKRILLLLFIGASLLVKAQPGMTLYGFSQLFTPGMIRADDNQSGRRGSITYYIYMSMPAGTSIRFDHIWIDGNLYEGAMQPVDSTPVINVNYSIPGKVVKRVLVPKTRQLVLQVLPHQQTTDSLAKTTLVKKLISRSSLVISYWYKGRKYYSHLDKLVELEPVAGM